MSARATTSSTMLREAPSFAPRTFASFRDAHRGETILVCGCGESLAELEDPARFVTIGVNDVGRRFDPDYLVVVNPRSQFSGDRYRYVEESRAGYLFTQLDNVRARAAQTVRFKLGTYGGSALTGGDTLDYTQNSPYVAACLAAHMGARRIALIGVDFTQHHFFGKTGVHPLAHRLQRIDLEYAKLAQACAARGIELVNASARSRLASVPKVPLRELAVDPPVPRALKVVATPQPASRVFFVSYKFLSCGDVFTEGLRHAARRLGIAFDEAPWDDPRLPEKVSAFAPTLIFVVHGRRFAQKWRDSFVRYRSAVWLVDEPYEVDDTSQWSRRFGKVFVNDPATLARHRNARYLPVCFDPERHYVGTGPRDYACGFIGGGNEARERFLAPLAASGALGYVVGGPWRDPALRRICLASNISSAQAADLYRRTRIVINVFRDKHHFNRDRIAARSMNPRIYEALACGALVVSERRPEIAEVFPRLPQFDHPQELVAMVNDLLSDAGRIESLANESRLALEGHTYADRLKEALGTGGETATTLQPTQPGTEAPQLPAGWIESAGVHVGAGPDGVIRLSMPPDGAGGEAGIATRDAFNDVELAFDMRLSGDACFIAKLHHLDPAEPRSNSYHLLSTPKEGYLAKHWHVFRRVALERGRWQRVTLRWVDQSLELRVDGTTRARAADTQIQSGYCFIGLTAGVAELRNIELRDLTPAAPHRLSRAAPAAVAADASAGAIPRRHLLYHVWPVRGAMWKWNVEQLLQRIDLFNGRRIVGIVSDARSEPAEAVKGAFAGHGCEFIELPNEPLGEVVTFPAMLARLETEADEDLVFYGHAKGVRHEPRIPAPVRRWAEVQYQVALDNWLAVREQMSAFPMTGVFRMLGRFRAHQFVGDWHYSGTFFWMRNAVARSSRFRPVPRFYGGVEAWPGTMFAEAETGCLFMDKLRQLPYSEEFWRHEADRAFEAWKRGVRHVAPPPDLQRPAAFEGHAWPRLEQVPSEFSWWLGRILERGVSRLLTIGSMCGGAEWHTARVFRQHGRDIAITAVEVNVRDELRKTFADARQAFGQQLEIVAGDSASSEVRGRLAGHYDAVFIDGDHGYRGCRADYDLARSLKPGIIGLHDIVDSDWHADARCCVSRVWREAAVDGAVEETKTADWGGIGIVLPA